MKTNLSFLIIFFFALSYSQTGRDTVAEQKYIDEQKIEDFKRCNILIKDFEGVSFKKLGKIVANNITFDNTKKSMIIQYTLPFGYKPEIIIDIYDYTPVYCNYKNPIYNQSDFWNKTTVKYLQRKYFINLIPYLHDKGEFINDETVKTNVKKDDKAIKFFLKSQMTEIDGHFNANNGEKYYYFPYKNNKNKIDLSEQNSQKIEIKFRNYLGKIVSVQYKYDEHNSIYNTYQYQNKKWVEIPTIEEYKF